MTVERPYVLLSAAMSIDGYINDTTADRLMLSGAEDFDRVDEVRAGVDAILVGAATIRADNPRLLIRSAKRRAARIRSGSPENPIKVTITASGELDSDAAFFAAGAASRIVYTVSRTVPDLRERLKGTATVVGLGDSPDLTAMLSDLRERGIHRLMVEGGAAMHTRFLTAGLFDELHLSIAPFFVGDPAAPRFAGAGRYVNDRARPLRLIETRAVGNVAFMRLLAE